MAIVVDTCSLVMMARNYLPLDDDNSMVAFIKQSFAKGKLLLLDIILDEARRTSKGVVLERMPFLDDKKNVVKTTDLLPPAPRKFDDMVDNNFCVRLLKNELTEEEYIQQKSEFMKSGDAKIVVYSWSMNYGQVDLFADYSVMTEETRNQNDGKLFKKLPLLCDFLKVKVITAVDYLYQNGFKIVR
jgi:hypothetical protein